MLNFKNRRLSRRNFTRAVASGSLFIGLNTMTGSLKSAEGTRRTAPLEGLPRFDGHLSFDSATRNDCARDYGGIVHKQPVAVLRPGSVEDISRVIDFARRRRLRIAARGHGHQPFGQAQVSSGIVIDMRSLHSVHSLTSDSIEVDAGADWRTVLRATLRDGLAPPVLTNYLDLTVGGTLSIGGVGLATLKYGSQVDQTRGLQIVTGKGEIVACSDATHRDLFEVALAGQGQCGVIARAVLRLERAPRAVREYNMRYPDLQTLIGDSARVSDERRFDGAVALIVPADGRWSYLLTTIRYFTLPDVPDDSALMADLRFSRGSEQVRSVPYLDYMDAMPRFDPSQAHADLGLCIPRSMAGQFAAEMLPRLTPQDLGTAAGIRMFFWKQARFGRPLLRLPKEELLCYMALLRSETNDSAVLTQMLSGNRTLFEHNRSIGGTLYPFAALEMWQPDWEQHYGPLWPALRRAKRRYDPAHVFASAAI